MTAKVLDAGHAGHIARANMQKRPACPAHPESDENDQCLCGDHVLDRNDQHSSSAGRFSTNRGAHCGTCMSWRPPERGEYGECQQLGVTTERGAIQLATSVRVRSHGGSLVERVRGGQTAIPIAQTGRQPKGVVMHIERLSRGFVAWEHLRTRPPFRCGLYEDRRAA